MQTKEWTLMFYFASDNPLASSIVSQLKALKDAGYHPDANVIAHFDPHVVDTPIHVFDVNGVNKYWYPGQSAVGFASNNPFVRNLVLDRLWDEKNEEIRSLVVKHVKDSDKNPVKPPTSARPGRTQSGEAKQGRDFDPPKPSSEMLEDDQYPEAALANFLNFCRESYPARHYLLFILGHGQVVGNDSLLYDENASRNSLLLTELGEVLRTFNADVQNDREPGQVEMIGLHSCSMSAMEVAYELRGAARYMLASQGPAYVGSWPYKQILIRVFNDLNSELTPDDINGFHDGRDGKQTLVEKLREEDKPIAKFLRTKLERSRTALESHNIGTKPAPDLINAIVGDFNKLLGEGDTTDVFKQFVNSSNGTSQLSAEKLSRVNLRRLNRLLLADVYPEIARYPRFNIDTMLHKIFYYCLYNSFDFQLAGYPYDLCLTNLTKVSETEDKINKLADSLIQGLEDKNPLPKQLIRLAHLDAQSFYAEDYVDLYDFCLCLMRRYEEIKPNLVATAPSLESIFEACKEMRDKLEKKPEELIALSAFSGPAYHYSNGLSIFFPWTKPVANKLWDEEYACYRLNKRTRWKKFLEVFFDKTTRETRAVEMGTVENWNPSAEILAIARVGSHVFGADGRLQKQEKPGPDHPMGKYGPDDPTGGSCNCPTIKNYPQFIRVELGDGKFVKAIPMSEDFLAGKPMVDEELTDQ